MGNGGGEVGVSEVFGGFDEVATRLVFVAVAVGVVFGEEFLGDVVGPKIREDANYED